MRSKIVPISNVSRLSEAGKALLTRAAGLPGMGLVYGDSGLGKSTGIAWLATRQNGIYVRAMATSTPSSLLESICREIGISARNSNVRTVEDIVRSLALSNRPLFIDEADYLVERKQLVETLRDIHDLASVPVVLIGMKGIERKITTYPQLFNRIAQWVEFAPCTIEDTRMLAKELCEVEVRDDLLKQLQQQSGGIVRLVVIGLNRIEQIARSRSLNKVGIAEWPQGTELLMSVGPRKLLKSVA